MIEGRRLTHELDAILRVRERETGYRDKWRIWLAGGGGRMRGAACRALITMNLPGG